MGYKDKPFFPRFRISKLLIDYKFEFQNIYIYVIYVDHRDSLKFPYKSGSFLLLSNWIFTIHYPQKYILFRDNFLNYTYLIKLSSLFYSLKKSEQSYILHYYLKFLSTLHFTLCVPRPKSMYLSGPLSM